ncbi:MAG: methyltransferase domain-containing protein [Gammaproteobacteria bacterium]|nr:methyltransferase domain-containing protein [Gammaproteobacteria bacterium]
MTTQPSTHAQSVNNQFDPQAAAYLASPVHAAGPDLARARELVAGVAQAGDVALDLGCGAGHLAFNLAPSFARMVALDASQGMLDTVRDAAAAKGLGNIVTELAAAEDLPFADGRFAVTATRYSAHHWGHVAKAMQAMRRVTRPGGYVLVIDIESSMIPLVDTHIQSFEFLRDHSHVRDYTGGEWRALFAAAGIELIEHALWPTRMEFVSWVERMRTPPDKIRMIRALQLQAPQEVRDALAIEEDGSFTLQTGLFWGRVAG